MPELKNIAPPTDGEKSSPPNRWVEGLSAEMPVLDALEIVLRQRLAGVLYYLPLAAEHAEENVEHVHKLRVSSRRLAAVLDVLAEGFPEAPRKALFQMVEKIRKSCGRARDLDVQRAFLEGLLAVASVEDAAVIELLCEHSIRRRTKVQKKLRRKLPKLEQKLQNAGKALLSAVDALRRQSSNGYGTFGATGVRILRKELAALWERAAVNLESPDILHQVRIACKHLRYALEVFTPVLDESFRHDYYPQVQHIQDMLGEFHDAVEASRALRRQRKKWKHRRGTKRWEGSRLASFRWRELRAGLDSVTLEYNQQADHARTEFLDLWPGFAGDSFRTPVDGMLSAVGEERGP